MCFSINQTSSKKRVVMDLPSSMAVSQNSANIPNPKSHIPGGTLFSLS